MNQNHSIQDRLNRAKRALGESVDTVRHYMLKSIDAKLRDVAGAVRFIDLSPGSKEYAAVAHLYYFSSNALNRASFTKKVDDVLKWVPSLKSEAAFTNLFNAAVQAYLEVEPLVAARKQELADKRAKVAAKAAQKADLNLQEGVSLAGVDVGQYQVILAGLEPVRQHVLRYRMEQLASMFARYANLLEKAAGVAGDVPEWKTGNYKSERYTELPKFFCEFFESSRSFVGPTKWVRRDSAETSHFVLTESRRFALAYVQGYAVKLAGKVGDYIAEQGLTKAGGKCEVTGCSVSSADLWHNSIATITIGNGQIKFHTQIIWNQSCHGKQFNQWPTRLLS